MMPARVGSASARHDGPRRDRTAITTTPHAPLVWLVAALVAVCLISWPVPPARAQDVRSPDEHRRRLVSARDLARAGQQDPSPARFERIRELAGRSAVVDLGDRRVELGVDSLLAALEGESADDFRAAAEHIDALVAELEATTAAEPVDATALDDALDDAYRGIEAGRTWQEHVALLAGMLVSRVVAALAGAGRLVRVLALVALAAGLIAAAVWLARRATVVDDERREHDDDRARGAVDWRRRADEALERGDLEEALRARFRLLVAALDARGLVEDAPSLTPAECRAAVTGRDAELAVAVRRATDAVEAVVYGARPADREHVAAVREAEAEAAP